jgi:hypothetical protein
MGCGHFGDRLVPRGGGHTSSGDRPALEASPILGLAVGLVDVEVG